MLNGKYNRNCRGIFSASIGGAMRTYDELFRSAMSLRYDCLQKQRDPRDSVFTVTEHERCVLRDQPWQSLTVDHLNERFCGFKLHVF